MRSQSVFVSASRGTPGESDSNCVVLSVLAMLARAA